MNKKLVDNLGKAMQSKKKRAYTSVPVGNGSSFNLIRSGPNSSYLSKPDTIGTSSYGVTSTADAAPPTSAPAAGNTYVAGAKRKAKRAPAKKQWSRKVDNSLRDAYGETDFAKKTIVVNKKKSKEQPLYKRPVNKGATKYPDVLATMVHEELHKDNPKMTEKDVRKAERAKVSRMSPKEKKRVYSRFA